MIRVLFVCMANICRSPAGEAILRNLAEQVGKSDLVQVDSCAVTNWSLGGSPSPQMVEVLAQRGIELHGTAKQFDPAMFAEFDHILAVDTRVLNALQSQTNNSQHSSKLRLVCDYSAHYKGRDIPDPYQGPSAGFEHVVSMLEDACEGFIRRLAGDPNSPRLLFRRMQLEDAWALYRTVGDPEVMQYYSSGPDLSLAIAQKRVAEAVSHWEKHGYGDWTLTAKADNQVIGYCGFLYCPEFHSENLGYALQKSCWGQGLATEAVKAVIDFGQMELHLQDIFALVDPANAKSIRVLEKCGLVYRQEAVHNDRKRLMYRFHPRA